MSESSVFLVGMMGSGKTTIGRHLATLLGFAFEDTGRQAVRRPSAVRRPQHHRPVNVGARRTGREAISLAA